jgi:hypothetical protein
VLPALKVLTRVTCRVVKQLLCLILVTNKAIPGPSIILAGQMFWICLCERWEVSVEVAPILPVSRPNLPRGPWCSLMQGVTGPMQRSSDILCCHWDGDHEYFFLSHSYQLIACLRLNTSLHCQQFYFNR